MRKQEIITSEIPHRRSEHRSISTDSHSTQPTPSAQCILLLPSVMKRSRGGFEGSVFYAGASKPPHPRTAKLRLFTRDLLCHTAKSSGARRIRFEFSFVRFILKFRSDPKEEVKEVSLSCAWYSIQ
jgi:hypothetical protein